MRYMTGFWAILCDQHYTYALPSWFSLRVPELTRLTGNDDKIGDERVWIDRFGDTYYLHITYRFAWNGPSFPGLKWFTCTHEPSLIHDAMYYLMYKQNGFLPFSARLAADLVWRDVLPEHGCWKGWDSILYWGVRIGGNWVLRHPQTVKEVA